MDSDGKIGCFCISDVAGVDKSAKYVKKIDFDKETGEILTASSVLDIDEDLIKQEEALDGYYVLLTSEMDTPDEMKPWRETSVTWEW